MLLNLNTLKSQKDCEEFLFTLMKRSFQDICIKKFGTFHFPFRVSEDYAYCHASFLDKAENPFDFVFVIDCEKIETTHSFLKAVAMIYLNRKHINRGIDNYNG